MVMWHKVQYTERMPYQGLDGVSMMFRSMGVAICKMMCVRIQMEVMGLLIVHDRRCEA